MRYLKNSSLSLPCEKRADNVDSGGGLTTKGTVTYGTRVRFRQ